MNQIILNIEKSETSENLTESDIIRRTTDIFKAIGHEGRLKIYITSYKVKKLFQCWKELCPTNRQQ